MTFRHYRGRRLVAIPLGSKEGQVIDKEFATEFYFNKNFMYCIIYRNSCVIDT